MSKKKEVPNDLTPIDKRYTTLTKDLEEMEELKKLYTSYSDDKADQKSDN